MLRLLPWVGGMALLVVGAWFKEGLASGLRKLTQLVYARLAGSLLLRRTALNRYARALYREYETFPVLFRVDDALKMPMASVYVPLRLATRRSEGDTRAGATEMLAAERLSVVLGTPGSGKSMLLRSQILEWATAWRVATENRRARRRRPGQITPRPRRVPVLFALNGCDDLDRSLESYLVERIAAFDFPNADRFVARALREGRLAVFFDGLDEVATDRRTRVAESVADFARRYDGCPMVVTCRSAVYEGQLTGSFDQVLRVEEFDERLIRRFLRGWPDLTTGDVEQLMGALRDTPQLMPLARNPLLLTMVAYLYSYEYVGTDQALPHTRADFYKEVTDNLLGHLKRGQNRFPRGVKKDVLRELALAMQDVPPNVLDRLALSEERVLDIVRSALAEQRRPENEAEDVLGEIVDRSGLLLRLDGGERYQFAHLTLQEYLAAEHLADDPARLLDRYRADPTGWREVMRLWCGVAGRDCTEVIEEIFAVDPVLAFQCLADALRVDDTLATKIIEYFQNRLGADWGDHEVVAAFGLVAANRRPRGLEVFEFLRFTAYAGGPQSRRDQAVQALAATNDARAVDALAPLFGRLPAVHTALTSLGDRAVPAIARLAQIHIDAVVGALWNIGTPRSALALVDLLWMDREVAGTAALALGCLLANPDIEESLRTASTPGGGDYLHWVWQPFASGHADPLVRIAGRIVWLLQQASLTDLQALGERRLDPRIALPLCIADGELAVRSWYAPVPRDVLNEIRLIHRTLGPMASHIAIGEQHDTTDLQRLSSILRTAIRPESAPNWQTPARMVQLADDVLRAAEVPEPVIARLGLLTPESHIRLADALFDGDLPRPGPEDWLRVRGPRSSHAFDFNDSWHYRLVLTFTAAVTAVATARAVFAGLGTHPWGPAWLDWVAVAQIAVAWIVLVARGVLYYAPEFTERAIMAAYTLWNESTWAFGTEFWGEFSSAVAALGLLPMTAVFWFVTEQELWGLPVAIIGSVAVVSLSAALWARGLTVERVQRRLLANPFPELLRDAGLI